MAPAMLADGCSSCINVHLPQRSMAYAHYVTCLALQASPGCILARDYSVILAGMHTKSYNESKSCAAATWA